jgi:hypothetical protein
MGLKPPEIVTREMAYPRRDPWILLGLAFLLRLIFLPINEAEYTDGILQVLQFREPIGIWPPLYSALIYPLGFVVGDLYAGRLVSAIAGSLAIIPIYRMTQRAFGTRAALYAGIFYLTAPVAMRWGVRVMTDATFVLFFWWACERLIFACDERHPRHAQRALMWGTVAAVLASLTRFQGLMLIPPVLAVTGVLWYRHKRLHWKSLIWLAGLGILPLWVWQTSPGEFIHTQQFAERAFDAPMPMIQVIALNGEAFFAYFPYFMTYPVFFFALAGSFWMRQRRGPYLGWFALYTAVVLLIAQSAFSSFQERYLLPIMGFFWILAGAGMFALQERWLRLDRSFRSRMFPYVLIFTYTYSSVFMLLVMFGQRQAFGDLASASRIAASIADPDTRIFTNELYRAERPGSPAIEATKVQFFADRPVEFLGPQQVTLTRDGRAQPPLARLSPGTLLVLSDLYGEEMQLAYLSQFYDLEIVEHPGNPAHARLLPLLPDNMSRPYTNQNPFAWQFRYEWQEFSTTVYRVRGRK